MARIQKFFIILFAIFISCIICDNSESFDASVCESIPKFRNVLKNEIRSMSRVVKSIIRFVFYGSEKGQTYRELA
jgi:hypothetical protein